MLWHLLQSRPEVWLRMEKEKEFSKFSQQISTSVPRSLWAQKVWSKKPKVLTDHFPFFLGAAFSSFFAAGFFFSVAGAAFSFVVAFSFSSAFGFASAFGLVSEAAAVSDFSLDADFSSEAFSSSCVITSGAYF